MLRLSKTRQGYSKNMRYIKELDGLRAFAILSVITTHWFPKESVFYAVSTTIAAPNIFFTISGFLITVILFKDCEKAREAQSSKLLVFRNFFLKRSLRILPAYYIVVIADYLISKRSIQEYTCYLNYTSNFAHYYNQKWGPLPHLWSMAVEQQFYLIWPLVILLVPSQYFLHVIILFISIGVYSQLVIPLNDFLFVLPQTCFDALGFGALLAWVLIYKPEVLNKLFKVLSGLACICLVIIVCEAVFGKFFFLYSRTLISIITTWIILYFVLKGDTGNTKIGSIFNNKGLVWMGKMSYGIYLYHFSVISYGFILFSRINKYLPVTTESLKYIYIAECFVVLLGISWISLKYVELPISRLKSRFKIKNPDLLPTLAG